MLTAPVRTILTTAADKAHALRVAARDLALYILADTDKHPAEMVTAARIVSAMVGEVA
jgi:hypothetical protein